MSDTPETRDGSVSWIASPWAGAALRFAADPAADLDPDVVTGWPAWASLDAALGIAGVRGKLGRWLVGDDGDAKELIDAFASPRARLLLVPADEAETLIRLLGAWLDAPRIAALIRRREIEATREAIGDEAFEFATRRAGLLGRPGPKLTATIGSAVPTADAVDPSRLLPRGAIALGLAIGAVPTACATRLRLRRPTSLWSIVAEYCRDDEAGEDAWTCVRRLIRDRAPAWSTWLN